MCFICGGDSDDDLPAQNRDVANNNNHPDQHPKHRQHPKMKLRNEEAAKTFKCSGCKEYGFGPRYQCATTDCNFLLHELCFKARSTIPEELEFLGIKYEFKFYWEPPKDKLQCDACGRDINGCWYHGKYSKNTVVYLHPCCTKLGSTMRDPNHKGTTTTLILKNKMPMKAKCKRCDKNKYDDKPGWSYLSPKEDYGYHVYCLKKWIREKWEMVYLTYHLGTRLRG